MSEDTLEEHNQPGALAHLNMMQAVISRLAGNSSSCKTWCLTVVGIMLALAGSTKTPHVALLAVFFSLIFALLDSLYLARERLFRALFTQQAAKIAHGTYGAADRFSMAISRVTFSVVLASLRSSSIWPFYCGVALTSLFVAAVLSAYAP